MKNRRLNGVIRTIDNNRQEQHNLDNKKTREL